MKEENYKKIEKAFVIVFARTMDFVDDKVKDLSEYDRKAFRANVYSIRDNLVNELKATDNDNETDGNK